MDMAEDDASLVERCKRGDAAAFDDLVRRHRSKVLNLALQMMGDAEAAEDLAQEAFVSAFRALPRFRGESSFFTWVYRITLNLCFAFLSRRHPSAAPHTSEAIANSPAEPVLRKMQVRRALDTLGPELRSTLILREIHGLTYQEIAEIASIPVGTVRSRLSAARERFRKAMEE